MDHISVLLISMAISGHEKMITYHEFLVLVSLITGADAGFPEADLPYFTMQATEGDPRGDISVEDAFTTFDTIVNKGWAEVRDDGGVSHGICNC